MADAPKPVTVPLLVGGDWSRVVGRITVTPEVAASLAEPDVEYRLGGGFERAHDGTLTLREVSLIAFGAVPAAPQETHPNG